MPMDKKISCQKTGEDLVTDWMWGLKERSKRPLMFQACKGLCTDKESQMKKLPLPPANPSRDTHAHVCTHACTQARTWRFQACPEEGGI